MKVQDVRQMNNEAIEKKLLQFKKELFNLRFQKTAGQLTNTSRMRYVRKAIAKLLTILNERLKTGEKNA